MYVHARQTWLNQRYYYYSHTLKPLALDQVLLKISALRHACVHDVAGLARFLSMFLKHYPLYGFQQHFLHLQKSSVGH